MPSKQKKNDARKAKRGEERKRKVEVKTAVSLLNPKQSRNFAFRACPNFARKYFASLIRRLLSVRPVNDFVVSFNSL